MVIRTLILSYSCLFLCFSSTVSGSDKIVIAKNGAGQDLIENSLPAITMASLEGVDTLELQINVTSEGELILFKDTTLNRLSNAMELFPLKNRADGGYYVVDFSLAEIRQLRVKNVFENDPNALSLSIPTLPETLSLIQTLESKLQRHIGISIEIVDPEFYLRNGKDISALVLDTLISFGYPERGKDRLFLQSASSEELQRIHTTLLPAKQVVLPLIQLVKQTENEQADMNISEKTGQFDYDWLFTNVGLRLTASYATAIALPEALIFSQDGTVLLHQYLEETQKYGLKVLVYSVNHPHSLREYADTLPDLLEYYYKQAGIAGVYTDDFRAVQEHNISLAEQDKRQAELPEFFSKMNFSRPNPKEKIPSMEETKSVENN